MQVAARWAGSVRLEEVVRDGGWWTVQDVSGCITRSRLEFSYLVDDRLWEAVNDCWCG